MDSNLRLVYLKKSLFKHMAIFEQQDALDAKKKQTLIFLRKLLKKIRFKNAQLALKL